MKPKSKLVRTFNFLEYWMDAAIVLALVLYLSLGAHTEIWILAGLGGLVFAVWLAGKTKQDNEL